MTHRAQRILSGLMFWGGLALLALMLVQRFLMPILLRYLERSDQQLPTSTRFLIHLSDAATSYQLPLFIFVSILIATGFIWRLSIPSQSHPPNPSS